MQEKENQSRAWARIVAKCWSDPKFKERLKQDPEGTLAAEGIALSPELSFEVHEDTERKHHLLIPEKPPGELSENDLQNVVAGLAYNPFGQTHL